MNHNYERNFNCLLGDKLIKAKQINVECPICHGTGIIGHVDEIGIACNECCGTGKYVINNDIETIGEEEYKSNNPYGDYYYFDDIILGNQNKKAVYKFVRKFIGYSFDKKNEVDNIKFVSGNPKDIYDFNYLLTYQDFYMGRNDCDIKIVVTDNYKNVDKTINHYNARILKRDK
jgi:hypothetical protein